MAFLIQKVMNFSNSFCEFMVFSITIRDYLMERFIICAPRHIQHLTQRVNRMILFFLINKVCYVSIVYFFANMAIAFLRYRSPVVNEAFVFIASHNHLE